MAAIVYISQYIACFNAGMRIKFLQDRINGEPKNRDSQNSLFGHRYNINSPLVSQMVADPNSLVPSQANPMDPQLGCPNVQNLTS